MVLCRSALATVVLVVTASLSKAQAALRPGDRFIGAWLGGSPDSPVGDHWGKVKDRQLVLLGIRAEWVIEAKGPFALAATADLIPVVVATNNPTYRVDEVTNRSLHVFQVKTETGKGPVLGAGFNPFGFKMYLTARRKLRVYGAGGVGVLWFTRDTPVVDARRFNLAFEAGGGFELVRSPRQSIVLGYKFHHLSNVYTAPENPGMDSNVIHLGFLHRR